MKFIVSRTSCSDEDKPCKEAKKETVTKTDERNVDDPMKNKFIGSSWYDKPYFNHRVKNGHIQRDYLSDEWIIELNSLEDLLKFIKKYGSLVIQKSWTECKETPFEIEIYDDWRE